MADDDLSECTIVDRYGYEWTIIPVIASGGDIFDIDPDTSIDAQSADGQLGWVAWVTDDAAVHEAMWDEQDHGLARGYELYDTAQEALDAVAEQHGLTEG